MSISVNKTGPYKFSSLGVGAQTSYATYAFFSGLITTTDSFEDNIFDFGVGLKELYIINQSPNILAFQFPENYITTVPPTALNVASGIVVPQNYIRYINLNKKGIKLRSAANGLPCTCYVQGI